MKLFFFSRNINSRLKVSSSFEYSVHSSVYAKYLRRFVNMTNAVDEFKLSRTVSNTITYVILHSIITASPFPKNAFKETQ